MPKISIYFEKIAGTHLDDALRSLRDAGSADALYTQSLRDTEPEQVDFEGRSVARDEAMGWRVTYCRRSLLFSAFAAEAYVNDFLYATWGGQDREALERLSTVDKYAILPRLAGASVVLDRGAEPLQKIKWLFARRNELVHAAPRDGLDLTWDPANHNPRDSAEAIVAVASAAATLAETAPKASILSYVLKERSALLEYGRRAAAELPEIHDPPVPDLLAAARRGD